MGADRGLALFYGWWDPRFVILVVAQVSATWLLALLHGRTGARGWLALGIVLNLASLGTFKYLDFLLTSVEAASGIALPRAHLILPIGISFFSFQLISYLVDRLRGDAPLYPFRPFALFVLVFPHVIAGPIVRHNELVPQFDQNPLREGLWSRIGMGLVIFTIGLGKKVLLADRLALIADRLFSKAEQAANTAATGLRSLPRPTRNTISSAPASRSTAHRRTASRRSPCRVLASTTSGFRRSTCSRRYWRGFRHPAASFSFFCRCMRRSRAGRGRCRPQSSPPARRESPSWRASMAPR